jgi:hypothetical protein
MQCRGFSSRILASASVRPRFALASAGLCATFPRMFTADDFQYALENTRVLLGPRRQIATFGNTHFRFHLLTESMDRANEVRIRDGTIHAERPQLLTPEHHARLLLDNFGEQAAEFAEWLRQPGRPLAAVLKYGFQFRRSQVQETVVHDSLEMVSERIRAEVEQAQANEPLSAVVQGVEDAWEVCLLKFTCDLVQESSSGNIGDLRRRGLL